MSDDLYYPVGVTLDDDLWLRNAANPAGVTGQAANLTMLICNTGVFQATAGVTFSEVSSASMPGVYHVQCNPTTSFVAASGEYSTCVNWSGDPTITFSKTYRITPNTQLAQIVGNVTFTSTANNGRVTDGTNPLTGVQVFLYTPANALYTGAVTNAAGNWGPVAFPSSQAGTWTGYAQLAGYLTGTFSLTVASTGVTGPGVDVGLTAISSSSTITLAALRSYGRLQVRGNIGTLSNTLINLAANNALGMLAKEYQWSWLKSVGNLIINGQYSAGSVTMSGSPLTTVTLTGGTWPAFTNNGYAKLLMNGKFYRISTAALSGGSTICTLTDAYYEANIAGVSYVLYQDEYPLASDCLKLGRLFPGMTWGSEPAAVAYETILDFYNRHNTTLNYAAMFGTYKGRLAIWPYPTNNHDERYLYYREPQVMVNDSDIADWDPLLIDVLYRAIDYQLAIGYHDVVGGTVQETYATYKVALAKAMAWDKDSPHRPAMISGNRRSSIADRTLPPS
jgi:hypothetical protein